MVHDSKHPPSRNPLSFSIGMAGNPINCTNFTRPIHRNSNSPICFNSFSSLQKQGSSTGHGPGMGMFFHKISPINCVCSLRWCHCFGPLKNFSNRFSFFGSPRRYPPGMRPPQISGITWLDFGWTRKSTSGPVI